MRLHRIPAHHVLATCSVVLLFSLLSQPVIAGPSSPHLLTELQPDNVTTVQLYLRGDEHHFYYQDVNGHAIVRYADGWLFYWNGTGTDATEEAQYQAVPPKVAQKNYGQRRIKAGCDDPSNFGIVPGQIPRSSTAVHATYNYDTLKRKRRIRRKRQRRRPRRADHRLQIHRGGGSDDRAIYQPGHPPWLRPTNTTLPTRREISTLMNSPMPDPDIYVPQLGCAQPKYSHTTIPHFLFATDAAERIQRWRNLSDDQG